MEKTMELEKGMDRRQWVIRGYMDAKDGKPFARAPKGKGRSAKRQRGHDPRWAGYMEGLKYGTLSKRVGGKQ
ncbi:MAG: hypothetical protein PHZ19_10540 [Candidatus Thermoplasmatota archaeon]|nr:hypothetical protein [Candidatus Thermoplasmatota archaeon]